MPRIVGREYDEARVDIAPTRFPKGEYEQDDHREGYAAKPAFHVEEMGQQSFPQPLRRQLLAEVEGPHQEGEVQDPRPRHPSVSVEHVRSEDRGGKVVRRDRRRRGQARSAVLSWRFRSGGRPAPSAARRRPVHPRAGSGPNRTGADLAPAQVISLECNRKQYRRRGRELAPDASPVGGEA